MIDRATLADLAALIEIEQLCFGDEAWSETLVRAELDAPARTVIVVREQGGVAGYASVTVAGDLADLQRVAVLPTVRRRGQGRLLLDEAIRTASIGGAERLLLEVAADNAAAIALYHGAGFADIDRRIGYYGSGRDALVLSVRLPEH